MAQLSNKHQEHNATIPDWIVAYYNADYQSSAGKAIKFLFERQAVTEQDYEFAVSEIKSLHQEVWRLTKEKDALLADRDDAISEKNEILLEVAATLLERDALREEVERLKAKVDTFIKECSEDAEQLSNVRSINKELSEDNQYLNSVIAVSESLNAELVEALKKINPQALREVAIHYDEYAIKLGHTDDGQTTTLSAAILRNYALIVEAAILCAEGKTT